LKTKDSQHEQEMKAKQAEAMQQMEAAQRSHEEELKRQQAEPSVVGGGRTEASAEDGGDDEAA
jgi:hypothetical protein